MSKQEQLRSIQSTLSKNIASIAMLLGIITAIILSQFGVPDNIIQLLQIPGKLWIQCLKLCAIPYVFLAVFQATSEISTLNSLPLSKLLKYCVLYFIGTTLMAILEGMLVMWSIGPLFRPSSTEIVKLNQGAAFGEPRSIEQLVEDTFLGLVPSNAVSAFNNDNLMIPLIVFSATMCYYLKRNGSSTVFVLVDELYDAISKIIDVLRQYSQVGIFFIMVPLILKNQATLGDQNLLGLIIAIVIGSFVHLLIVLPTLFYIRTRQNPYFFLYRTLNAFYVALASSSNIATLPECLKCIKDLDLDKNIAKICISVGTALNNDGSAMGFAITIIFMAISQDKQLTIGNYVVIVALSVLASLGMTNLPNQNLVYTIMIANQVGLEITNYFSLLVRVSWLVGRLQNAVNAIGTLYLVPMIEKHFNDSPEIRESRSTIIEVEDKDD